MEIEVFAGFSASEVLYDDDGNVRGIATRDVGIGKDGEKKDTYEQGMELRARQTLFAEGARGSCSEEIMEKVRMREIIRPSLAPLQRRTNLIRRDLLRSS